MQSNTTKESQRGLEAMQVLPAWHFGEILGSWISLLRADLILSWCLPSPVRSQHPWGRASLSFFSPAPPEVLFCRWGVAGDGAYRHGSSPSPHGVLPQRDCMVACLDDGHAASSAHAGLSSHINPGKERGHLWLCLQPSWTLGATRPQWNLGHTRGSVQHPAAAFWVNSNGKGATYWTATHDPCSTWLLLGDPLRYLLT